MNARANLDIDDLEPLPLDAYAERSHPSGGDRGASNGAAHSPDTEAFAAFRLDEIDTPPRQAVVQGLGFDRESVAAVVGTPNAGKTAFGVSLAVRLAARAERWLGLKIAGGPVLYFGAEAPGSVIMRARAARDRVGTRGIPLYISATVPGLGGERSATIDADRIIATVRAVQSAEGENVLAVFLDTLAACLADGDENGDGMLRLVAGAKYIAAQTGALLVLIHHPSKGDASGLRGHGSLAAACDSIVRIETEELTGVRTATLSKARDCATGLQIRFELEQVTLQERDSFGDPRTTIVVRPSTQAVPRPRPSGKRQGELLNELERRYRTDERTWSEAQIREAGRTLGMPKMSAKDALRGLITAGYIIGQPASHSLKYPPTEGTK